MRREGGRELDRRNDGVEGRNPEHERGGWVSNVGGMRRGWISAGLLAGTTTGLTELPSFLRPHGRGSERTDGGAPHIWDGPHDAELPAAAPRTRVWRSQDGSPFLPHRVSTPIGVERRSNKT